MGTWYVTTAHGTAPKSATCEGCGTAYFYVFERSEEVLADEKLATTEETKERCREYARQAVLRALERECGAAPCPQCGLVQRGMVRWAKGRRRSLLPLVCLILSGVGIVLGGVQLLANPGISWSLITGFIGAGVSLFLLRTPLDEPHPNSTPVEDRIERGRQLAITREEFERRPPKVDRITQETGLRHVLRLPW